MSTDRSDEVMMPEQETTPTLARFSGVPLILGLLLVAIYLTAELTLLDGGLGFPLDDSWIHMQFARNLAAGEGLSYNAGEMVPGSTAPLWTALLSLGFLLPGHPFLWAKVFGIIFYFGLIDATRRLAGELGLGAGMALWAAALTAVTTWMVWSALSGMEITLFALLTLWGMIFHIHERRDAELPPVSLALFGLSVLARPEGLLLCLLAAADRLLVPQRSASGELNLVRPPWGRVVWGTLSALILFVPVALFNQAVSESGLPTTFSAKSSGFASLLPNLKVVYDYLSIFFSTKPYMTFAAVAGCLVLIERFARGRKEGMLPALWLLGLPLAYSALGSAYANILAGAFGRYFFPLFPLLSILGVLGLERVSRAFGWTLRANGHRVPIGIVLIVLLSWPSVTGIRKNLGLYMQSLSNVEQSNVAMAHWLGDRLPAQALLAVNDVGALKYLLPNRIVDLAAIISPEISTHIERARSEGRDWHEGTLWFLNETRPDYLVIFPNWFPRLQQLDPRYKIEYMLEIPGNVTMGGDRLAVMSTPWSRYPLDSQSAPAPAQVDGASGADETE